MAVTRPLKEGSVTTYQQKVALGFPDILASEMDADLDTIYAAWNGNVGTANLVDGSVTYAKLAPDAQLWRDTGTTLVPGTSFATRPVAVSGSAPSGAILIGGTRPAKTRVIAHTSSDVGYFMFNRDLAAVDTAALPSWLLALRGDQDSFLVARAAAGAGVTATTLLTLDASGNLTATGNVSTLGPGTIKGTTNVGATGDINFGTNNYPAPMDATKASWNIYLSAAGDSFQLYRRAPNAGAGVITAPLIIDGSSNMTLAGATAVKAAGTTWANPSDRRLKDEIADYATGLAAILQLQPRTFLYNGKGGSTAGMRGYGFVADEVASIMPETVGVRAAKLEADDEAETEIETLDQSNLILALVNAVKELAARVDAR